MLKLSCAALTVATLLTVACNHENEPAMTPANGTAGPQDEKANGAMDPGSPLEPQKEPQSSPGPDNSPGASGGGPNAH